MEKQSAKQLPSPQDIPEPGSVELHDEKLLQTWSSEQIANTPCEMKMPSFKTIYRQIDKKYLRSILKNLCRKGKTRQRFGNSGRVTTGKSIRKRDKKRIQPQRIRAWKADTVVSGQGKSKACFTTLAERKTRYYIAVKIPTGKEKRWRKRLSPYFPNFRKKR